MTKAPILGALERFEQRKTEWLTRLPSQNLITLPFSDVTDFFRVTELVTSFYGFGFKGDMCATFQIFIGENTAEEF